MLTNKAIETILKHGSKKCIQAARMNRDDGEGGHIIAIDLDVHHNSTSALIQAGCQLLNGEDLGDSNQCIMLKDVKKGDYFKRKINAKTTFIRGDYCRYTKKYMSTYTDNVWGDDLYLKGTSKVFVGFTY